VFIVGGAKARTASTYKIGDFPEHGSSRAMTNELDNIFASLPTDPARKRKHGEMEAASKGAEHAPPPKRAGAASAPAPIQSGEAAHGARRSKAPPSDAPASDASKRDKGTRAAEPKGARTAEPKNARTAQSTGDAPGRRVPVVVHDTSVPARTAAPAQPVRPMNDEDAAFADSRGRDRMYGYLRRQTHGRGVPHFYRGGAAAQRGGRYVAPTYTGTPLCPFDCDCCRWHGLTTGF